MALDEKDNEELLDDVRETDSVPLVLKDIVALCDTDKLVV